MLKMVQLNYGIEYDIFISSINFTLDKYQTIKKSMMHAFAAYTFHIGRAFFCMRIQRLYAYNYLL